MTELLNVPLDLPRLNKPQEQPLLVLAGDAGGTKTNLALYRFEGRQMEPVAESTYHSASYESFHDILLKFAAEHPEQKPHRICLGVAGPVFNGKVDLTNLDWKLDALEIREQAKVQEVSLINDLEATAYGLATLKTDDFIAIHEGIAEFSGNIAIIAPGTGLGEAGLYWDGTCYHPFPTEGGHTDFGPRTKPDMKLLAWLQKKYEIVSWERVIAGPAIHDIYLFLKETKKRKEPDWLRDELQKDDPSAVISRVAIEEKNAACIETMQFFVRYLARQSSNLALTMKATGGLFLAGGIPPKIAPLLQQNIFYHNFLDCDRMQALLRKIPVRIILNSKTPLQGAAWYGAFGPPANNNKG